MYPIKLQPREYQKNIFNIAKDKNTLVVLPTGVGKTLIALMLAVHRLKQHPTKKILMLAPTRPLVEQHLKTFKKQLPELFASLELFTGTVSAKKRQSLFNQSEIIFSTPQCIANDLENSLYDLKEVSLLVIDEAHRCLKNYDYNKIAQQYKQESESPLLLGLTASPGSDSSRVLEICKNLGVDEVELRTRDSPDVKPYLQNREFVKIEVPFPAELMEIRSLLKKIFDTKVEQLRNRGLLHAPANKITLLGLQNSLAKQVYPGNFQAMVGMSLCAQAIKISHAIELLETQTLSGTNEYLLNLKKQASEKKSKGVQTLVNSPEFKKSFELLSDLISKKIEHPKIEELAVTLEKEFSESEKSKVMIFAQFRDTASALYSRLKQIPLIKPSIFIGQAKKNNSSGTQTGLSQKEQKQIISDFTDGKINTLISTSIGEEGLDIPEVNAVYFYEPIPSAIRKIQRAGRTARLMPGKLCILITKGTRDEIYHYASSARERKMHKVLEKVKTDLKEEQKNKTKTLEDFKQ